MEIDHGEYRIEDMHTQNDILILGVGNLLMKDEGVGVHVVERLKTMQLPENVEVLDGATSGFDLIHYINGYKKLIVIDAVTNGEKPGTLYRLTEKNLEPKPKVFYSLHQIDFLDAIDMAEIMGMKPEKVVVIGIEPKDMSAGISLSPEIQSQIPLIIDTVMKEIGNSAKGSIKT